MPASGNRRYLRDGRPGGAVCYRRGPASDVGSAVYPPCAAAQLFNERRPWHNGLWLRRGHRRGGSGGRAAPGDPYHGRRLVSHEPERGVHGGELPAAGDHGNLQQHGAGHGTPVANGVLRQTLFQHRPAPEDRLCKAGRGLRREGLPLQNAGRVFRRVCRGAAGKGACVDRMPHPQG